MKATTALEETHGQSTLIRAVQRVSTVSQEQTPLLLATSDSTSRTSSRVNVLNVPLGIAALSPRSQSTAWLPSTAAQLASGAQKAQTLTHHPMLALKVRTSQRKVQGSRKSAFLPLLVTTSQMNTPLSSLRLCHVLRVTTANWDRGQQLQEMVLANLPV